MKICHITKATSVAGSEKHLLTLLTSLDKAKYQTTFVLLVERDKPLDDFVHRFEEEGVQVKRVLIRGDVDPLLVRRLYQLLREGNYDLVHTHLIHADLYGTLAAKLAGVPIIVSTKHNENVFRRYPFYAFLDRTAARFADRIITISDSLKRFAVEVEGLDAEKIVRIHYGLGPTPASTDDTDRLSLRAELGISRETPLAATVARLIPQKGHVYLLHAFRRVLETSPEAKLLVVGDGYLREELESLAQELDMASNVIFTGFRKDVPRILNGIDLFVLSSLWEGFGLVLLEAMAASKPIVATRVSAIPEIVLDGETGILVPSNDPELMAEAITRLLTQPTLAKQMGCKGKQRLEQEFSEQKMIAATELVYDNLITAKLCQGAKGYGP